MILLFHKPYNPTDTTMHHHNENPLTSRLLEAIFTDNLPAVDNLLSKHPELLSVSYYQGIGISPLMQAINLALCANNLDILECMLAHQAALPYYNANLIEDLLASKIFVSDKIFNLVVNELFQYLNCPDERQIFLQNVFISLIRYGNYPRSLSQINFLFELGLDTSFNNFKLPADAPEQHKKLILLHFKLILEEIAAELNLEQYDKHGQNLINLTKHILPNYEEQLTSFFNADNLLAYLASTDIIAADIVLQKFVNLTHNIAKLQQTAIKHYKFKQPLYFQSLAIIYNTFKRSNLDHYAQQLLDHILTSDVFGKVKFAIEIFKNQRIDEKFNEVIYLILESINQEEFNKGYNALRRIPDLALKFLEVLMFYNLYSSSHPLVRILHTLTIPEKLAAIKTLLEPTINSSSNSSKLIAHVFKLRQELAKQLVLGFTEIDKYQLIDGTDDPASPFGFTRKTSAERVATLNDYHKIVWFIPEFNESINNLIDNIDLDEIINNEESPIISLARYFIVAYKLGHNRICANILDKIKANAETNDIIWFCSELIQSAMKNLSLWLTNGQDINFLMNIKSLIMDIKQVDDNYYNLYAWNKIHYLALAEKSIESVIKYLENSLANPCFTYYKIQIEILRNATVKATLLLKDFAHEAYDVSLKRINQLLIIVLKKISHTVFNHKLDGINKLKIYSAIMQELDFLCSIDIKIMLSIFNKHDNSLILKPIKHLIKLNLRIIDEINLGLEKVANPDEKKLYLSQALAFTFLLPDELNSNKLAILRICLTLQVVKNGQEQEIQNMHSLARMRKSQCFAPYFKGLLASTNNPQTTILAVERKFETPKL